MFKDTGLTPFNAEMIQHIREALASQHVHLGQIDRPTAERSITARNYDSAIKALAEYMQQHGNALPTKSLLENWREDMLQKRLVSDRGTPFALKTINARLAAVRKLLRGAADDIFDMQVKLVLRDWANVKDAKATAVQDKIEEDYGVRLARQELEAMVNSIDIRTIKGLRDRALVMVMAGAGLRVSEAVHLTMRDAFLTMNNTGQRGIRVRRGKHNKARIVVLGGWHHPVLDALESYTKALGLDPEFSPEAFIFRGVKRAKNGAYNATEERLSERGAERAVNACQVTHRGGMIQVNAHDLRRTYAKLCRDAGMSWDALREQMGHSSVKITEDYVGHHVDWSERVPNWTIKLQK